MRVILTAFGTSGDVNPVFALANALRKQGDRPVVITNPYWAAKLKRLGLEHRLCGEPWDPSAVLEDPRLTHPHFGPFNVWRFVYQPLVAPMFEATKNCIREEPTAIVLNHIWCFGGFLAAEAQGVPTGMIALAPLTWYSSADPSLYGATRPPKWIHGWAMRQPMRWLMNGFFSRSLRKECNALNLNDHKTLFFSSQAKSCINIGLWSPMFRGMADDDPPFGAICGFPWTGEGRNEAPLAPKIEQFLADGDPPIILGLGSALPRTAADIYQQVCDVSVELGVRAILVGADENMIPNPPDSVLVVKYAPYITLFKHGSVILHHAGIGTLAEALCSGRPSIAIPFGNDQFDNAFRAEKLGVSKTIHRGKVTPKRLKKAIASCLSDETMQDRARKLGFAIVEEQDGAITAAQAIRRAVLGA